MPPRNKKGDWVLLAHTCNPSYSGGRDQEDCSSRPAWAKNKTLSQKYPTHKRRTGGMAQVVECLLSKREPEFKLQYCHQKKTGREEGEFMTPITSWAPHALVRPCGASSVEGRQMLSDSHAGGHEVGLMNPQPPTSWIGSRPDFPPLQQMARLSYPALPTC
jgi:hypothetical protein